MMRLMATIASVPVAGEWSQARAVEGREGVIDARHDAWPGVAGIGARHQRPAHHAACNPTGRGSEAAYSARSRGARPSACRTPSAVAMLPSKPR